jgi:hypothetical protein
MFEGTHLKHELIRVRSKTRKHDDEAVSEVKKILKQDLLGGKKILENLPLYKNSFTLINEEDVNSSDIFTPDEIKKIAIIYRLKFLEHNYYKPEIPYELSLKIQRLNISLRKEIKEYMILAPHNSFVNSSNNEEALLFLKTNYDNYYLLHSWGKPIKASRRLKFLPLRSFETLVTTIFVITLLIAISLPTKLITLDHKAEYWSGYRAAAFFHLLIFNFGVTVYFTFAFAKNFSSSVWNRYKDF